MNRKKHIFAIKVFFFYIYIFTFLTTKTQSLSDIYPVYKGSDLGAIYSKNITNFRVWSPTAVSVTIRIYSDGAGGLAIHSASMNKDVEGSWVYSLKGDWKNKYYTYQVKTNTGILQETADIYAKAVGVNGVRGMIINLQETNPANWSDDKKPPLKSFNDIILWEIHIRDFSQDQSSGITNKGKYLAFTEKGTRNTIGDRTGLDHIIDLGVTHVHLLPCFDFRSIDETKPNDNKFNWGYDPQNYNVPEGSYSSDPYHGEVRIKEFKEMIQSLHANGIRVIMDVVYNHTSGTSDGFDQLVPGYYYRHNKLGMFANASACGNETASEQPMMRKFMIESVNYWAQEYHIDGFRFDLMAIHDIETMNQIRNNLDKIDKSIYIYGEGWMAGESPLANEKRASKLNAYKLDRIAVFSDEIRDAIRGPQSQDKVPGFMGGKTGSEESLKFGIIGGIYHPQINYKRINYTDKSYVTDPAQTIVYVSCHDDPCLWDKIQMTRPELPEKEKLKIQKLANAIVLTSQGVPLLHAGEEMVRTKKMISNSYNSPDSINNLDWDRKTKYFDVFTYYQQLISLRKNHPAFKMPSAEMINQHLKFLNTPRPTIIGYEISNNANGDIWKNILVFFNGGEIDGTVAIPEGIWKIVANGNEINDKGLKMPGYEKPQHGITVIPARSMLVLVDEESLSMGK